jgi:hypothetical protein
MIKNVRIIQNKTKKDATGYFGERGDASNFSNKVKISKQTGSLLGKSKFETASKSVVEC